MKKFQKIKTIKPVENSKLTKEQMHQTKGGRYADGTSGTRSICHVDGTDDADSYYSF